MTPYLRNVVRTAIPAIIGAVTAYLAKHGLDTSSTTAMAIMPVASTVYYAALRKAEEKWPKLSWLLGAFPVPKVVTLTEEDVQRAVDAAIAEVKSKLEKVDTTSDKVKKTTAKKSTSAKKTIPKNIN